MVTRKSRSRAKVATMGFGDNLASSNVSTKKPMVYLLQDIAQVEKYQIDSDIDEISFAKRLINVL